MTRRAASARGYFARQIIPPDSPASVGQYQLRVADDGGFELVCRVLLNTLEERDWRSEWSALWGRVTEDGDALTFHVERGQREVRSCAWDGRGVEDDYRPTRRFEGRRTERGVTLEHLDGLELRAGESRALVRALILPDYLFG